MKHDDLQNVIRLVDQAHRLTRKCEVRDTPELFDARTRGLPFGPLQVVSSLKAAVECGTAENYTFHFAMTAIVYAMALEKLDPEFFKEKKQAMPQGALEYETRRQEILAYVRALDPEVKR